MFPSHSAQEVLTVRNQQKELICACSDGRQLDDVRRWCDEQMTDAQPYGLDVPGGALRLILGTESQREVLMEDLALLVEDAHPNPLWLCAHTGTCAGVAARGHRFRDSDKERQFTQAKLIEAGRIVRGDPRFVIVSQIRLVMAVPVRPGSDDFEFMDVTPDGLNDDPQDTRFIRSRAQPGIRS